MHKEGAYKVAELIEIKEYRDVIRETNAILNSTLDDNKMSKEMLKALKNDIFYFSQLKTNAQLTDASRLLRDADKKMRSFESFSNEVTKIKTDYNENYLEAEYDFAKGSVLMAERWDNFEGGDAYLLQYRTAGDDKVRESHQKLDGVALPKEHEFWDKYFPPNGWRCRCTTVEMLARNNPQTDGATALKNGEESTHQESKSGSNKLEIFRFNPGKQKVVFPPTHPYRKVKGAKSIKK